MNGEGCKKNKAFRINGFHDVELRIYAKIEKSTQCRITDVR